MLYNQTSREFIVDCIKLHQLDTAIDVLEIGSFDSARSVRQLFLNARSYIGTDRRPGPNVDRVIDAHDLDVHFDAETFDLVICHNMAEFDQRFWITFRNIAFVLRGGGNLIYTTHGPGHVPSTAVDDFWRFTPAALRFCMTQLAECDVDVLRTNPNTHGVYGFGIKKRVVVLPPFNDASMSSAL